MARRLGNRRRAIRCRACSAEVAFTTERSMCFDVTCWKCKAKNRLFYFPSHAVPALPGRLQRVEIVKS